MLFSRRVFVSCLIASGAAGCSAFPSDGPLTSAIVAQGSADDADGFEVIDIDSAVVDALQGSPQRSLERTFGAQPRPSAQLVQIGDVLSISVWEGATGGLFASPATSGAPLSTLPNQVVDASGDIAIPFGGTVHAAGLSPRALTDAIRDKLHGKAIQPQVQVNVLQSAANSATVAGDVTGAARVPLNVKSDRLLDVIAQAGGVKAPVQETFVRITRGDRTATVALATILARPEENIYVHPGDLIYVYLQPQTFTALGAVTHPGELAIDRLDFTLAEALGVAGGLNDNSADSQGVFIFRLESPDVVRAIRPDAPLKSPGATVPVIYLLSFANAAAFFMAKEIAVHSQDIVYVANAPEVEWNKFVTFAHGVAATGRLISTRTSISVD
jgi:polysaccharide export outer membrane protein